MYDLRACRVCLNQGCKLERMNDITRRLYCTVTGLDFTPGECYPNYLCVECTWQMRKILAFRRRCRRAFFVLKEIVAVRQKVTLADLSTVDRKKTNLKSNIDYWRNSNVGFYSVHDATKKETDTKSSNIREFLTEFQPQIKDDDIKPNILEGITRYTPKVVKHTYVAVDIKPDNSEEFYEGVDQKFENLSDGEIDIRDGVCENNAGDEGGSGKLGRVDLKDVFKGLPEEKSDGESDYGLPEPELPKPPSTKRRKMSTETSLIKEKKEEPKSDRYVCGMENHKAILLSRTLMSFTIELLSSKKQMKGFQARKECEPYKSAGFKCSMCLVVFPGMPELLKHVEEHNKKQNELTADQRKKYQCVICKDSFSCQEELTAHSACFHWYKYECNECQEDKYTLFDILKCHKRPEISVSHHYTIGELYKMSDMTAPVPLAPMEYNCRYCGLRVYKKDKMETHEQRHVEPPKRPWRGRNYMCDLCGTFCSIKAHLADHMHTHYKKFTCQLCSQVLEGWNAAYCHLREHKKFKCLTCEETFRTEPERRKHQVLLHNSCNAKYDCTLCGLPVYSLPRLYQHQLNTHGYISINDKSLGDPRHRCEMCGTQFVDQESLRTHMLKKGHVDDDKLGGKCDSCKKIFFTVEEFVTHRRDNKVCKRYPVKCVYCDEMLKNFRVSARHYELVHPTQPNEHHNSMLYTICEFCGKAIVSMHIKAHTKKHTTPGGEPTLTCTVCKAKLFTSRAYVSHMLFNHTPKPYICALCPYRGKHRSECREHILKIHAPELPYSCQKCTRKFSHLDLLQQHSVKSHGVSAKADRSVYLPAKDVLGKIYVFPHMKLDGSLIEPSIIENAGLYLYDYLCKSHKLVDWKDYYVFDAAVEPVFADPHVLRKREYNKKHNRNRKRDYKKERNRCKPADNVIVEAIKSQIHNIRVTSEAKKNESPEGSSEVKGKRGKKRKCKVGDDAEHETVKETKLDEDYSIRHNVASGYESGMKIKGDMEENEAKFQACETDKEEVVQEYDMPYLSSEKEEIVQGYDMPDLQAEILGEASEVNEDETNVEEELKEEGETEEVEYEEIEEVEYEEAEEVEYEKTEEVEYEKTEEVEYEETKEVEYEELDMSQLLSENYEVIEDNGEQYVIMNGNLYRLQTGDD